MRKCIKWLAWSVISLFVLVMVAVFIIVKTINPNDYKPQIITAVNKATGRSLSLPGNLSWSFFPNLGIRIGQAVLANPPGYNQPVFAQVQSAEISIAIMPLFSGQVQANSLSLDGLQLNLVKKSLSQNNWTFSGPAKTSGAIASTSAGQDASAIALVPIISNLNVHDANITYTDLTTGITYKIDQVNFKGSHIQAGAPFGVNLSFMLSGNQPQFTANVTAKARLYVDWGNQIFRMDSINAESNIIVVNHFKQRYSLSANIEGSAAIDLHNDTFIAEPSIRLNKIIDINAAVNIKQLSSQMNYDGSIKIAAFNLNKFIQSMGMNAPKLPSSKALTNISLQAQFNGDSQNVNLNKLLFTLNQSTFQGQGNIMNLPAPVMNMTLAMDKMDLADYVDLNGAGLILQNANLHLKASSKGWTNSVLPSTLNGQLNGTIQSINLRGLDINAELANLSKLISNPKPNQDLSLQINHLKTQYGSGNKRIDADNGQHTSLGSVNLVSEIQQGVLKVSQLTLSGPSIQVKGGGSANLNKHNMNFLFYMTKPSMQPSLTIPYRVSGAFTNPSEGIDWLLFQVELQKYLLQALSNGMQNAVQGAVTNLLNQLVNAGQ